MEALLSILIPYAVPAFMGIFSLIKTIKFVQEGQKGIRLRFGRAVRNKDGLPKIIEPGFVFMIPFVDKLQRRHVRHQTLRMEDQRIMLQDGLIFTIDAAISFIVTDIYKSLFVIQNIESALIDICMGTLREEFTSRKHEEIDLEEIKTTVLEKTKNKENEWGVQINDLMITDYAPTPEAASLLNTEIAVSLRGSALKKLAEDVEMSLTDIPPSIAAAAIGIPLVTAIGGEKKDSWDKIMSFGKRKSNIELSRNEEETALDKIMKG